MYTHSLSHSIFLPTASQTEATMKQVVSLLHGCTPFTLGWFCFLHQIGKGKICTGQAQLEFSCMFNQSGTDLPNECNLGMVRSTIFGEGVVVGFGQDLERML